MSSAKETALWSLLSTVRTLRVLMICPLSGRSATPGSNTITFTRSCRTYIDMMIYEVCTMYIDDGVIVSVSGLRTRHMTTLQDNLDFYTH